MSLDEVDRVLAVVVVWAALDPVPVAVRSGRLGYPAAGDRCHTRHRRDNQPFEAKFARIRGHVATSSSSVANSVSRHVVDLDDVFEICGVDFGQVGRHFPDVELTSDHIRDEACTVFAEQLDLAERAVDGRIDDCGFVVEVGGDGPLLATGRQGDGYPSDDSFVQVRRASTRPRLTRANRAMHPSPARAAGTMVLPAVDEGLLGDTLSRKAEGDRSATPARRAPSRHDARRLDPPP